MIKTSENVNELFKALAEFQAVVQQPKKDAANPFFKSKYVPLENVVDVIHEAGAPLGLHEATYPVQEDGMVGVGVIVTHASGQFIQYPPVLLRPAKNDPQGVGAALTYARRYALSAAFGIASETDDDANSISGGNTKKVNATQVKGMKAVLKTIAELTGQTEEAATDVLLNARGLPKELSKLNEDQYGEFLRYLSGLQQTYEKKAKAKPKE